MESPSHRSLEVCLEKFGYKLVQNPGNLAQQSAKPGFMIVGSSVSVANAMQLKLALNVQTLIFENLDF